MSKTRMRIKHKAKPWNQRALIPSTGLGFYYGSREPGRGEYTSEDDGVCYDPESREGRAITSMMDSIFGPSQGRTVAVGTSRNIRI